MTFETKDSGERKRFASGMQRDTTKDKVNYMLVFDGPMFERWVELLHRGATKYDERNWMQANSLEELERFKESAVRHFFQWLKGERDEDHAAAVFFNINGYEYTMRRLLVWEEDAYTDPEYPTDDELGLEEDPEIIRSTPPITYGSEKHPTEGLRVRVYDSGRSMVAGLFRGPIKDPVRDSARCSRCEAEGTECAAPGACSGLSGRGESPLDKMTIAAWEYEKGITEKEPYPTWEDE